jgi:hypothetical protein
VVAKQICKKPGTGSGSRGGGSGGGGRKAEVGGVGWVACVKGVWESGSEVKSLKCVVTATGAKRVWECVWLFWPRLSW